MSGEVGRCGAEAPTVVAPSGLDVCALPSGHVGWHRSDNGTEWTERGSHDHRPAPSPAADVCACGCDIADHGLSFGCIRCRNCTEFAERSTYVPLAERPSPSPAADDEFPCGWCNADGSEGHRTDCPSWTDAPSPAAEPPDWLVAELIGYLQQRYAPLGPFGFATRDWLIEAKDLLAGPLAPLLARLRDAEAVVERCEAEHIHRDGRCLSCRRPWPCATRRALSGDAR